jgi:signal transduction histidine kinase
MRAIRSLKNTWGVILLGVFILANFSYFAYIHLLSRDYNQVVATIGEIKLLDRDVTAFLDGRFAKTNFDNISETIYKLESVMNETKILLAGYGNDKFVADFMRLEQIFLQRKELAERHKADSALLNNSYRYLYDLKIGMEADSSLHPYHKILDKILYGFTELMIDGATDSVALIDEVGELELALSKTRSEEPGYFVSHSKLILSKLGDITVVAGSVEENRLTKELELFLKKYREDYDAGQKKQNFIFLAMILLSLALLAGLAYHAHEEAKVKAQLGELARTLETRVEEELAKNREKDRMMMHQSRLVAMGETISNIAHQWRQPLNTLILILHNLKFDHEDGVLDDNAVTQYVNQAGELVENMSKTIDDFRNFFRPSTKDEDFPIGKTIDSALSMVSDIYKSAGIKVGLNIQAELVVHGFSGEFAQAILNILANSKDAIVTNNIANGLITIAVLEQDNKAVVTINDNGGGIPTDVKEKIFDPYFTTKHKSQGVGVGLYMAKNIIETSMGGKLSADDMCGGASFVIEIPIKNRGKTDE